MNHDNDNDINDAQLTAYALGELHDPRDVRAVESRLAGDEAARREVEQIRALAGQLQEQLAAEPMPERAAATRRDSRRPRWGARLALAAAVGLVVGGLVFTLNTPSLHRARETAIRSSPAVHPAADPSQVGQNEQIRSATDAVAPKPPQTAGQPVAASPSTESAAAASGQPVAAAPPTATAVGEKFSLAASDASREITAAAGAQEPKTPYDDELRKFPASPAPAAAAAGVSAGAAAPAGPTNASVDTFAGAQRDAYFRDAVPGRAMTLSSTATRLPEQQQLVEGYVRTEAEVESLVPGERAEQRFNTEAYDRVVDNPFLDVGQNPLSTFSIDVDTASYSNMRRFLTQGMAPPKDSVRIEELLNYFPYDYAPPSKSDERPFASHVEVAACPWEPKHRLVRLGLKGKEIALDKRPASNLVFLLDVSGSMKPQNRLPLVKQSMRLLLDQLNGEDRVAIVVYAGSSGLVLPSTACSDREKQSILNALEELSAGGSTNGQEGIQLAYSVAQSSFIQGGTNRVILCTDGDFNVGVTNQGDLTRIIEEKAKGGVFLSVLGFGMGNLKDSTMEKLADKGNGNYAYIDTLSEAKKVLVEQMSGTLITIAKDVKIQIEFNPAVVGSYRLIGYENRLLAKEDFNDDKKDAGEIGAGHAVTALYEVVPVGEKNPATRGVDELKYQREGAGDPPRGAGDPPHAAGYVDEMLTLKLRYKEPEGETSKLIEVAVKDDGVEFAKASGDFKFASAVAAFGMILRDSPHKGSSTVGSVLEWTQDGVGKDESGYRAEFVELVKKAREIGVPK